MPACAWSNAHWKMVAIALLLSSRKPSVLNSRQRSCLKRLRYKKTSHLRKRSAAGDRAQATNHQVTRVHSSINSQHCAGSIRFHYPNDKERTSVLREWRGRSQLLPMQTQASFFKPCRAQHSSTAWSCALFTGTKPLPSRHVRVSIKRQATDKNLRMIN